VEFNYLQESTRSLIDCEPTTNAVGDRRFTYTAGDINDIVEEFPDTRTQPTQTVDGLYIMDNRIGSHGLGALALHPFVKNVRYARNRGFQIGITSVCFAENIIIEDNVETSHEISPHAFIFARSTGGDTSVGNWGDVGDDFGGRNVLVRRNNMPGASHFELVKFGPANGGVHNYLVQNNVYTGTTSPGHDGGGGAQWWDETDPDWIASHPFVPFTVPAPKHALRDLTND